MKREHDDRESSSAGDNGSSSKEEAAGVDELLVVLGYKVRSSDMADVAHKLEQLEMVLGDGISQLSDETVHYNPSDLSGWVESLLSDLDPTRNDHKPDSEYDLRAIPGSAVYPREEHVEESRRSKRSRLGSESTRSMVVLDSQETGVRLVHALLACAEAVQQNNLKLADALVKHVGLLASSQAGAMRKIATYFAEGLARRIYRIYPRDEVAFSDTLQSHFYESCPYLKFAHFTANQAILEAFATAERVHVVDLGLNQGLQWPALIQALAFRPNGPPNFRLTGIGSSLTEIEEVGWKLGQLANTIGVNFEFKSIVLNHLSDLKPEMLDIRPGLESVAVNSVFELHCLLAHPGSIDNVLSTIRSIRPNIMTIVEQEANHNGAVFLDRFTESLHYYSSLFDSLEGPPSQDRAMSELYLGRQILNLVACEGEDRIERHETLNQWRNRFGSGGFEPVNIGSNAYKQASMLLALYAGADGYTVDENEGCLLLGWQSRPLIATSAWRINRNINK